jgi:hypothetical protein
MMVRFGIRWRRFDFSILNFNKNILMKKILEKSEEVEETTAENQTMIEPIEMVIPERHTIKVNPDNVRKIVEIPTVGFANYSIVPKSNPTLYYEMVSELFPNAIGANLAMTDEDFEKWGEDDEYIINHILEHEGLVRA